MSTILDSPRCPTSRTCCEASRSVDSSTSLSDADVSQYACALIYPHLRQLFTGIQVAGPQLTPQAMDEGFHAIPPHPSDVPTEPACFYGQHEYTCVKDS